MVLVACSVGGSKVPPSSSSPTSAENLSPRPRELSLDRVDPCSLLTVVQQQQLGVGNGRPGTAGEDPQSPACAWTRFPEEPQDAYQLRLDKTQGAEGSLSSVTGAKVLHIHGFATIETLSPHLPPTSHCVMVVDAASGQNLVLRYEYDGSTVAMTKQLACDKAKVAAEMAVQTLIEQSGG
ncbi:DUF3558 family protein [Pseudonocardia xinjiangensis]|uniref:DUF3558 domain-containing protein n=2 Tax=Pseudonocardia xinjiangensis TaxID=75289 RepID=A0ABX1RMU0_9PSEU|nr:DUF3558 domain-containing protein [Pseudonocardia xinjiangensis]